MRTECFFFSNMRGDDRSALELIYGSFTRSFAFISLAAFSMFSPLGCVDNLDVKTEDGALASVFSFKVSTNSKRSSLPIDGAFLPFI
jgi:hypothetical protein